MAPRTSNSSRYRTEPPPVGLNDCDREPIHIPGFIQPHGLLFSFAGADFRINALSANVVDQLHRDPQSLLNAPISEIFDAEAVDAVIEAAKFKLGDPSRLISVHLNGRLEPAWRALVHLSPTGVILEAKMPRQLALTTDNIFGRFDRATRRLQAATDVLMICARLAEEVRTLTGYGRVKIYRFASDWSGEVIAEDRSDDMPSYLGLHFPAEDIPVQARALYARNPERQIPDVGYVAVPLVTAHGQPIDLSQAVLRSVSPIHIEYLRNMQVGASMSVSIMRHGELWGLVACHNDAAHYVPAELRQAALLLTQLAAWQLALSEETQIARRSVRVKAIETMVLRESIGGRGHIDEIISNGADLLALLGASGLILSHNGVVTTFGQTPSGVDIGPLVDWLASQKSNIFETDRLAQHYPPAGLLQSSASGLVSVSIGGSPRDLMIWLRPEFARTVTWSGDPAKHVEFTTGRVRLTPRQSFAAWTEEVRGRSRPWQRYEVATANDLRAMMVEIVLRYSAELGLLNAQLIRSNEELEAFAYVASHDLKEPLRQIQTFGTLLARAFQDRDADLGEAARWLDGIQTTSKRLRTLVNDLVDYARLGQDAKPFSPTRLDGLIADVRADLGTVIDETGAAVAVDGRIPVVLGDPTQLRQVLQNVLSNALKYRHPDRTPVIGIMGVVHARPGDADSRSVLELSISDNGIGLEERHREQIFEPFQRLHSADEYEGSGIGLAICRKIMTRHEGTISVASRMGQGSTFTIRIPLQPSYEDAAP